jgi:dihydrofolate synthase / folylpolyglutamate synthase
VQPIRTVRVEAGALALERLVDESIDRISERSVLAVASKVVSLCENRIIAGDDTGRSKIELIRRESDRYLADVAPGGMAFTITANTLIPAAGIDESNVGGGYLLWPEDPQASANRLRRHLADRYGLREVGVILTDSTCTPLRRGTTGICLAHSGFVAVRDYIGTRDLFDRAFAVSQANLAGGLAAAAVVAMGEGDERTPLCVLEDIPNLTFQARDPTPSELGDLAISPEEDLFAPFLDAVPWHPGGRALVIGGDDGTRA